MRANDLEWLLKEHEGLDELLPPLWEALRETPPALERVRDGLAALAAELPIHLEVEEAVVFPWLVRRLPGENQALEALLRDHVQLLTTLSSLQLMAAGDVPEEDLSRLGQRFVRGLWKHSCLERALLERALEQRLPA